MHLLKIFLQAFYQLQVDFFYSNDHRQLVQIVQVTLVAYLPVRIWRRYSL
ncbi:hypothetical protein EFNM313_1636 [Enterococcus faecalis]|nr:hypothetical protein EFNM313_1636 [Enterococcus faecalis]